MTFSAFKKVGILMPIGGWIMAQQEPLLNQFLFCPYFINPAFPGMKGKVEVVLFWRNQWFNMPGAPRNAGASIYYRGLKNNFIAGATILSDRLGPFSIIRPGASAGYVLRFSETIVLSFALKTSVSLATFNTAALHPYEPEEPYEATSSRMVPHLEMGVMVASHRGMAGISFFSMNRRQVTFEKGIMYTTRPHLFIVGQYALILSESIVYKPSFIARAVRGAPVDWQLNNVIVIKNTISGVLGLHTVASVVAGIQADVNDRVRAGGVIEFYHSGSRRGLTSAEIVLGALIPVARPVVYSPMVL